jgi:16S rRNA (guanine527-N7)-methyltransferase
MVPLFSQRVPSGCDVSRETREKLSLFEDLLRRWNPRINLVAKNDVDQLWERHIVDSLQLLPYLPKDTERAIDLGSGGGFPGLILAIASNTHFCLVESDQRKASFLREAARVCSAKASVHPVRIEAANLEPAAVITARALAPLDKLMGLAHPLATKDAVYLFQKGQSVDEELTNAQLQWHMRVERFPSSTSPTSCLLRIRDAHRITDNE